MTADDETHGRSRWRSIGTVALVVAIVAGAVVAGLWSQVAGDEEERLFDGRLAELVPPEPFIEHVAAAWAAAWSAIDAEAMQALAAPPAARLPADLMAFIGGLDATGVHAEPGPPVVVGDRATVELAVDVELAGVGPWRYTTTIELVVPRPTRPADWRVVWSSRALHPELGDGLRLQVARALPDRAPLLAADGTPLTGPGAAPPLALAAQLIGRVGAAEGASQDRAPGDPVGTWGLEAAFDAELGGSASGDVQLVDAAGTVVAVLDHVDGRAATPVRTSIDLTIQRTAESLLSGVTNPAAIVALRPSTGELLASVSNPLQGFNRALNGRYPPGSTFKVVTTSALLDAGITPDTPTTCPEVATVGGRAFRNAEGSALGDIVFRRAFYESCNTAFVQLAAGLEPATLVAAAERFGFNAEPALEVPAEMSSFPEPSGLVDQVSAAIGQGRILVTPLHMASVAATVRGGAHRPLTVRAVEGPVAGEALPPGMAETLQELMRLVVAQGTGTNAQLPGEPAGGKTGTAEFGTERPPRTHAWFIGFRGDLAVAVVVEDADGFGGTVAAPLAREILRHAG